MSGLGMLLNAARVAHQPPFVQFSAETLAKPLSYICVSYSYNEYLAWSGTFDPAFLLAIVRSCSCLSAFAIDLISVVFLSAEQSR